MTAPPPPPYGQPPYGQPSYGQAPNNTLGLIALILGIASIVLDWCGIGIVLGIAAAVTGFLGKQKAAQGQATNGGQANAGFICGIIGAGIGILLLILSFALNFSTLPFN